jgi:predicted nucleic acid-binding protein
VLVVDASIVVTASLSAAGLAFLAGEDLVAPPLLWSEALSVLHEMRWRREISEREALLALNEIDNAPVRAERPAQLKATAWSVADQFGWAKTYDAEYVALAQLLGCRMVTLDQRLRRGAARVGFVVLPEEL